MRMNKKTQDNAAACPEPELLSAHFDGEERLSEEQRSHVDVCETCGLRIGDYGRIASGLKCGLESSVPSDLVERVKFAVKAKLESEGAAPNPEPRRIDFPFWISSLAAGLSVCALGAYMVTHMEGQKPKAKEALVAVAAPVATQPREIALSPALKPSELSVPNGQAPAASSFGAIDLSQLSSVSFGGDDGTRLIASSVDDASQAQRPASIDPLVKHVWLASAPNDAQAKLQRIVAAIGLDSKDLAIRPSDAGLKAVFDINRRQAAILVRACKSSGFELLSPQQPQPEQKVFDGNGLEPVHYEASFLFKRP